MVLVVPLKTQVRTENLICNAVFNREYNATFVYSELEISNYSVYILIYFL